MSTKKKKGFMTRLIEGSEKSEDYARNSLPSNRWELFWDILKGSIGKLFKINLMTVLFLVPLFFVYLINQSVTSQQVQLMPFAQNILTGYPTVPDITGVAQIVNLRVTATTFSLLPIAAIIVAVGLAGGFYVMRNLVWTEGVFVANDFWRGIRLNYFTMLKITLFYTVILFMFAYSLTSIDLMIAQKAMPSWILLVMKGMSYIAIIIVTLMTIIMCTMGVTYELGFFKLLKNAFLVTIGLMPINIVMLLASLLPFVLFLFGSFGLSIGLMLVLMISISFFMLVWTNYSHWFFDKYLNDKVEGAIKNRGIYSKVQKSDSKALEQYKKQIEDLAQTQLVSRPIKPITDKDLSIAELPTNYSRKHLDLLRESKERLQDDHKEYVEKHKNNPKYLDAQKADNNKPLPQEPQETKKDKK